MNWRDTVDLITKTQTVNDMGNVIDTKTARTVFCNKKSVRMNEFYQAHGHGMKAELMLEIRTHDYQDEDELTFAGRDYDIVRTYDKNGEVMELICKRKAGE